jgi:hypothetical protein
LKYASLTKLPRNDALRDFFEVVAGCCPCLRELKIINEASFLKPEDNCLRNIVFNATGF